MRGNDFVEPLGMRVLIRKDESRNQTRGGIVLPDQAEIPTITGRVVEVSLQIERDADFPIEKYDKVLFHPRNSIPVDFEQDNLLYVVPIEDVVAVFSRDESSTPQRRSKTEQRKNSQIRCCKTCKSSLWFYACAPNQETDFRSIENILYKVTHTRPVKSGTRMSCDQFQDNL